MGFTFPSVYKGFGASGVLTRQKKIYLICTFCATRVAQKFIHSFPALHKILYMFAFLSKRAMLLTSYLVKTTNYQLGIGV